MTRKLYTVQAQVVHEKDGWQSSQGTPTFFLDADIQGIRDEDHAERVARSVVDAQGLAKEVHISVGLESDELPVSDDLPEHKKLQAISNESQAIGSFLDWLQATKGVVLCERHEHHDDHCYDLENIRVCGMRKGELIPFSFSVERLLAEHFEIDLDRLEQEKQEMLEKIRGKDEV